MEECMLMMVDMFEGNEEIIIEEELYSSKQRRKLFRSILKAIKKLEKKELYKLLEICEDCQRKKSTIENIDKKELYLILDSCDHCEIKIELIWKAFEKITRDYEKPEKDYAKRVELIINHPLFDITDCYYLPKERLLLSEAVASGDKVLVQLILNHPDCRINQKCGKTGSTPLHASVSNFNGEILRLLLNENKLDPSVKDNKGRTAVMLYAFRAAKRGKTERPLLKGLKTLLSYPKVCDSLLIVDNRGESTLSRFLKWYGNESKTKNDSRYVIEILSILLQSKNVVNTAPHTLAVAMELSSVDVCEFLLKHSANPNSKFPDGESSLHCAVRLGSYNKVSLLVQYGANMSVTYKENTPLQSALAQGCSSDILEVLSYNADLKDVRRYLEETAFQGETLLTCCMRHGVESWVYHFVNEFDKEELTRADGTGVSALQLSCKSDNRQKALVIKYGPSILQNSSLAEFRDWYKFTKQFSTQIQENKDRNLNSKNMEIVRKTIRLSALPNGCPEAKQMTDTVIAVANELSDVLSETKEYRHFAFTPLLAGSVSERTKTFVPNEADVVCQFIIESPLVPYIDYEGRSYMIYKDEACSPHTRNWLAYAKTDKDGVVRLISTRVADRFYSALKESLRKIISRRKTFGYVHLKPDALQIKDKISHLQLLWRGQKYKDMLVYVDLVPAFFVAHQKHLLHTSLGRRLDCEHHIIAKASRHENESVFARDIETRFKVSTAVVERSVIAELPERVRHGLIVAKAVRITDISCTHATAVGLPEDVSSEDFITSYMLKNSLFHILPTIRDQGDIDVSPGCADRSLSEYAWADKIYEKLESGLSAKPLRSYFLPDEVLSYCTHTGGSANLPCCSKKRMALTLCRNIRKWLQQNLAVLEKDRPKAKCSQQSQQIRGMLAKI